jgi:hypothetical protein
MLCTNQFTNMETNQRVMQIPVHMELKMENRKNKTVKIILRKQDTIVLIIRNLTDTVVWYLFSVHPFGTLLTLSCAICSLFTHSETCWHCRVRIDITRRYQQGSEWVNREQIAHDSVSKVPNGWTENRYHTIVSARFRMGEQRTDTTRQCQQGSEWLCSPIRNHADTVVWYLFSVHPFGTLLTLSCDICSLFAHSEPCWHCRVLIRQKINIYWCCVQINSRIWKRIKE